MLNFSVVAFSPADADFFNDHFFQPCDSKINAGIKASRSPKQAFNKWRSVLGADRKAGCYRINVPYTLSDNFKVKSLTHDIANKNAEVQVIKDYIHTTFILPPSETWQLGHKNPFTDDLGVL